MLQRNLGQVSLQIMQWRPAQQDLRSLYRTGRPSSPSHRAPPSLLRRNRLRARRWATPSLRLLLPPVHLAPQRCLAHRHRYQLLHLARLARRLQGSPLLRRFSAQILRLVRVPQHPLEPLRKLRADRSQYSRLLPLLVLQRQQGLLQVLSRSFRLDLATLRRPQGVQVVPVLHPSSGQVSRRRVPLALAHLQRSRSASLLIQTPRKSSVYHALFGDTIDVIFIRFWFRIPRYIRLHSRPSSSSFLPL